MVTNFIKKLDILSPPITLYYEGKEKHSSIPSSILSVLATIIVFIFGIIFILECINKEKPVAYFFNHYVENIGSFPLNSSSLFHYIHSWNQGTENISK